MTEANQAPDSGFPATTEIIFAVELTTEDGVDRAPDDRADIPAAEARLLLHLGRARLAAVDDAAAGPETPPAVEKATRKRAPAKKSTSGSKTKSADTGSTEQPTGGSDNQKEGTGS